jgi:hypothetical protein
MISVQAAQHRTITSLVKVPAPQINPPQQLQHAPPRRSIHVLTL